MKNFILNNAGWVKTWLTENYPLRLDFIERHEANIDWKLLSRNQAIDYTLNFCDKYSDRFDWNEFVPLCSAEFKGKGRDDRLIAFLDHFKDKISWYHVTDSIRIPENTERVLKAFEDYWDWGNLSIVPGIPWNLDLLRKFKDKINWDSISVNNRVPWRYEWIEEFADLLDWYWFPHYSSYHWDGRSVSRFRKYMEDANAEVNTFSFKNWLNQGTAGPWAGCYEDPYEDNDDPVYNEEYEMNDEVASLDEVMNEVSKLEKAGKEIDCFDFIQYNLLTFSYIMSLDNVNHLKLASEAILTEPAKILRKYGEKLEWGCYGLVDSCDEEGNEIQVTEPRGISANRMIVWTEEMMDEFEDRIRWDFFGKCGRMKWTKGMVEKHFHKFDKDDLLKNNALFHKLILPEMNESLFDVVFGYNEN